MCENTHCKVHGEAILLYCTVKLLAFCTWHRPILKLSNKFEVFSFSRMICSRQKLAMLIEYLVIVSRLRTNLAANKSKMKYNTHTVQHIHSYFIFISQKCTCTCTCSMLMLHIYIYYSLEYSTSLTLWYH